jgi:hypothetical protein
MPLPLLRLAGALFAVGCSSAVAQSKTCPRLDTKVVDSKFKPGQVWTYRNRPGESESTVTILQVDRMEKIGVVVHIRVDGLRMLNPRREPVPSIEHMPFTRDAILLSVIDLHQTVATLPTLEGYDHWRADCGGVYTISVADAVSVAEKTFNTP